MSQSSVGKVCAVGISFAVSCLIIGCGQPVREDRTIEFSRDGGQVAFQHGSEGVFVADRLGGEVTKVFQPDENVLATSRPLASPIDGRLIFATAEPINGSTPHAPLARAPIPADGRVFHEIPVRFTCWLRNPPSDDRPAETRKLFSAKCGHVGYVSAGLALRWHPNGQSIFFVAESDDIQTFGRDAHGSHAHADGVGVKHIEIDAGRHSVFEFDIETEQTRRVFPHAASAVLCDWTPNGSALVCVVGHSPDQSSPESASDVSRSGIWIGTPENPDSWWHVPESERLPDGDLPSLIERLRAARPAWTADGSAFAFVSRQAINPQHDDVRHELHRVDFAERTLSTITESDGPITDLHWSGDGERLGFVTHEPNVPAAIRILDSNGSISNVATSARVRRFAGFDASGRRLAYVAATALEHPVDSTCWALLLLPDPLARDSVWIADADATGPGTEVFSGMRVTFPLWSPTESRLSLWLTFTPRYRSLLSIFRQWGLWPGDPAATIDAETGEISWMPISPQEELQIGHYDLLKRQHDEAWRWYSQARGKLPAARPPTNWMEFTQRISDPANSQVFEFLCLKRLGRDDDAIAKWNEFEENFFPQSHSAAPASPDMTESFLQAMGPQADLLRHLIRDLYVAEVFLSVDAVDDALAHFRAGPTTKNDGAKLSRAIILAQLLLIAEKRDEYLAHCTNAVLPLALQYWRATKSTASENAQFVLQVSAGLCLAPLFRRDFLDGVSDTALRDGVEIWQQHRSRFDANDHLPALAIDLMLRTAALHRDDSNASQVAEKRVSENPIGRSLFGDSSIDEVLARWFAEAQTILTLNPNQP